MKTILITGSNGFIGKNLTVSLAQRKDLKIIGFDINDEQSTLPTLLAEADFIFHLAGVNRPQNLEEFTTNNFGLTEAVVTHLIAMGKSTPLLMTSSIQADKNNPYGISKLSAEKAVFSYARETGADIFVYRLPNVFGKWCRPNYNSVVATFCHNVILDLPIQVNDPTAIMNLVYIDDVVSSFIADMDGTYVENGFCQVQPVHTIELGEIAEMLNSFKSSREDRSIPNMDDSFTKKLYATFLSYLPQDNFSYLLTMNVDERGSFTEFLKTADRGQVSVNIAKPGITKGNHWHHTKNEKFLVVSGQGTIRFRQVGGEEIVEYHVSADKLEVVDIPTGYTHNISNTGITDLVTIMWCNEVYDPDKPDTFFEDVEFVRK